MKKKTARTTETAPLKWQEAQNLLKCLKADGQHETRLLFAIGFYTGLRISDILRLRWADISGGKEINVQERKTGKTRKIQLHADLLGIIKEARAALAPSPDAHIFTSKKGPSIGEPLTVVGANLRIRDTLKRYGIKTQNASSHCLRKTFGRRVWEANDKSEAALILLSKIFNHEGPSVTRAYIGLTSEVVADAYLRL